MWFSNAIRNEQIKYMFNNEFDISKVELISYTFHHYSSLQLYFICKKSLPYILKSGMIKDLMR